MLGPPPTQLPAKSRLGIAEWIARLAFSLLFVLGMFAATTATPRVEGESDVSIECGEDSELVEQVDVEGNTTTRRTCAGVGAPIATIERLHPPRSLTPRRRAEPARTRCGPRRTAPEDDDDEALT